MELFKRTVILTRKYIRYGGDSESTLALVEDQQGYVSLYSDAEHDDYLIMNGRLFHITSSQSYADWLFHNYMDLLLMAQDGYPHNWWSIQGDEKRKKEFKSTLEILKKWK
mgnify:CR=1 FL=1